MRVRIHYHLDGEPDFTVADEAQADAAVRALRRIGARIDRLENAASGATVLTLTPSAHDDAAARAPYVLERATPAGWRPCATAARLDDALRQAPSLVTWTPVRRDDAHGRIVMHGRGGAEHYRVVHLEEER